MKRFTKAKMADLALQTIALLLFGFMMSGMAFIFVFLVVEAWDTPARPLNDDYMWERRDWDTTYGYYPAEIRAEMRKRYELHKKHEQLDQEAQ